MATRRDPLHNSLALVVLAYLIERPMHPYELGKLLESRNAERSIEYKHASLYMVVEQLTRAGYLEPLRTERAGQRPERTVYRPTESGRARLRERMRELVSVPAKEYHRFEAALSVLVVLPPTEVPGLLEQRGQALAEQIEHQRSVVAAAPDVDPVFLIEYHYRLELLEAERRFVDRFRALIQHDPAALGEFWQRLHLD
ncbi:PadR family transcriptional regulator [Nocardia tenerifensis]|uniref:PadR family transcriptional regulator n=1 Tax=Nocardia tenerifensis TaxID=228006 RepID=A0A318K9E2_9NOCA|nr:PadR family transcriptional regulator [Nocardia tenerifensis]PXX69344.1 PadR family transcriptional regulator [Nocardia tenerifensis]